MGIDQLLFSIVEYTPPHVRRSVDQVCKKFSLNSDQIPIETHYQS